MKYRIENFTNPNVVAIQVDQRISKEMQYFHGGLWGRITDVLMRSKYPYHKLVSALFEIEGVLEVTIDCYSIRIAKASMFDWEKLLPKVVDLVKQELIKDGGSFEEVAQPIFSGNDSSIQDSLIQILAEQVEIKFRLENFLQSGRLKK